MSLLDESDSANTAELPVLAAADPKSWLNSTFAGAYFVECVLGEGAMGQVLLATDIQLDRSVAIKVLKQDATDRVQHDARFRREARLLSRLSHPNIVTLYTFGSLDDGTGYIVMERVDGAPLTNHCQLGALLSLKVLVEVVHQTCLALAAAHKQGIVHRDIKPSNILLQRSEERDIAVKVLDFGLAKPVTIDDAGNATWDGLATTEGSAVGTPAYMSPEQACGDPVDGRSDLYGLACMVMELLTGHSPFGDLRGSRMVMAHLNEPPRLPSQLRQGPQFTPGGPLDQVFERALAKSPDQRFQSAGEFAIAFRAAIEGGQSRTPSPDRLTPVTGAFVETQAAGELAQFVASTMSGTVTQGTALPQEPREMLGAILLLDIDHLWNRDHCDDPDLIGDSLGIAAARVRHAIEHEGGQALGGLVGGTCGLFRSVVSQTAAVEAAVQAALMLQRHLLALENDPLLGSAMETRMRIGIEVGSVVAGTSPDGTPAVHGEALTGAKLMARSAGANEIRLSRRSYRLVRGRFRYRGGTGTNSQVGPTVVGRTDTLQARDTNLYGVEIPFEGRGRELTQLQTLIDDAYLGLPGGRALVVGAQGCGKSRLVTEALGRVSASGRTLVYDAARCTASGHHLSMHPFVSALRARAGVVHDDAFDEVMEKLDLLFETWLRLPDDTPDSIERMRGFLASALELNDLRQEESRREAIGDSNMTMEEGFIEYYDRTLARAPVLLYIDDFMFASAPTRSLLLRLVERFADKPFTTLLCVRSEAAKEARFAITPAGSSPAIELRLEPLAAAAIERLVRGALHRVEDLSDGLVSAITNLASGVPHIVVEAIFDLIESGVIQTSEEAWWADPSSQDAVKLPESAEQLFRDRVDRLTPLQRDLVQVAAVAGDVFWPDLLSAMALSEVTREDIEGLTQRGLFAPQTHALMDGQHGYGFAQIAMAESVYRNMPKSRRRRLHGDIGKWLEEHVGSTAHPIDSLIGTHFRLARMPDRALAFLVRCANRAMATQALVEAASHLERCLAIIPEVDDTALGPPERVSLTRDLGTDLVDALNQLERHQEAAVWVERFLGRGGALAGTDPVANSRLILARADALAGQGAHQEARVVYRSVTRLVSELGVTARALRAQLGDAIATGQLEGEQAALRVLEAALASVSDAARSQAGVERLVAQMESTIATMKTTESPHAPA